MDTNDTISKKEYSYIKNAEKADQAIEKLTGKLAEKEKAHAEEKTAHEITKKKLNEEFALHEATKKEVPSREDLMILHGSKADNILHSIIEKAKMQPIIANAEDLKELGVNDMVHADLKDGQKTETTNLIIEKLKDLPDGKTLKISSLHSKK